MTAPVPAAAAAAPLDPIDVCDLLLERLLQEAATSVWLDPVDGDAHEVSLERRGAALGRFRLTGGLGDAVLARLALIAGLDLLAGGSQANAARVRLGDHAADVVVAIRAATGGLAGEVRLFDDRATPVAGGEPGGAEVFAPGTRVGPYRVERVIGHGGMGVVYEVEHAFIARRFAMKVLFGSMLRRDPSSALRFVREARAAARVRHPGIVDVSDFGTLADGRPYLVMALLDGRSLFQVAIDEGPLPPARALEVVRQIAGALAAAHGCGVVHRDLTLANVFLQRDGDGERVVLVDFGSATVPDPEHGEVPDGPPGVVIGTPHYMSP
ncbi:MAG TPA: serine/threonine-protein kinase, partial [Kofleriaceae bacterium]|nr:serine/threonine-protein kinase [Kofleriaceae bacterium]